MSPYNGDMRRSPRSLALPTFALLGSLALGSSPVLAADGEVKPREVKYMVSPTGLRVSVERVTFTPTVELKRQGKGWGFEVRVEAKVEDDASHSLLAPKGAEIAWAGQVLRAAGGEPETFADHRENDRALELTPNKPVKLSRLWPAKNGPKALAPGDTLHLELGIWGLGADAASRRPVKKLCLVEVKFEKDKPRVKVLPPGGLQK